MVIQVEEYGVPSYMNLIPSFIHASSNFEKAEKEMSWVSAGDSTISRWAPEWADLGAAGGSA